MRRAGNWLALVCGVGVVYACESSDAKKSVRRDPEGGAAGAPAAGQGGVVDTFGGAPEAGATVGGAGAGGAEGGAAGEAPIIDAGAGGQVVTPPTCNETCAEGACVFDTCMGTTEVDTLVNLTTTPIAANRLCAEAPVYAVSALTDTSATLATNVVAGCLNPGDEVLLINLQGAPGAIANVGAWELLRVSDVQASSVSFSAEKVRHYGAASDDDTAIGTGANQQRVALLRVPRFGVLSVADTASLTANPWDGQLGGVVALRAGRLELSGSIDASDLGYRPGRASVDDITCSNSLQTEAGESIAGLGTATSAANFGASGGVGPGAASFNANNPIIASAGHALPGEAGTNYGGRTASAPGAAYGSADGSQLTLGSGSGGNLRCDAGSHAPLLGTTLGQAGGIVLVLADEITLTDTASISVTPTPRRELAFSGGYVLLRGQTLSLGDGRVTALGGVGKNGNAPTATFENHGGPGYIVLDAPTVTGTTTPAATLLQ